MVKLRSTFNTVQQCNGDAQLLKDVENIFSAIIEKAIIKGFVKLKEEATKYMKGITICRIPKPEKCCNGYVCNLEAITAVGCASDGGFWFSETGHNDIKFSRETILGLLKHESIHVIGFLLGYQTDNDCNKSEWNKRIECDP